MITATERLRAAADHIEKHELGDIVSSVGVMMYLDVLLYATEGVRLPAMLRWVDSLNGDVEIRVNVGSPGKFHIIATGSIESGMDVRVAIVAAGAEADEVAGEVMGARESTLTRDQLAGLADPEVLPDREQAST